MTDQGTTPTAHPPELGIVRLLISKPEFGPLVLLVLMIVVFTSINPAFASITNIGNALTFTVILAAVWAMTERPGRQRKAA